MRAAVRLATRAGAWLAQHARKLASGLNGPGVAETKHQMIDGFLIKASRFRDLRSALVLDMPTYALTGLNASIRLQSGGISGRDPFARQPEGATISIEPLSVAESNQGAVGHPIPMNWGWIPFLQNSTGATHQYGYLISRSCVGREIASPSDAGGMDDMSILNDSSRIYAVTQMFSPYCMGVVEQVDGATATFTIRRLYLQAVNLRATESDLPDNWKFYPRRKVPHTSFAEGDSYSGFNESFMSPSGGHHSDAQTTDTTGTDILCVAARVFRQFPLTWKDTWPRYQSDDEPPKNLRDYYDREGEQGLAIIRGASDRAYYNPEGENWRFILTVGDVRIVTPSQLPMAELHPTPVLRLPSWGGRPAIPNFGMFLYPHVARAAGGFVTFTTYSTLRDTNSYPAGWVAEDSERPLFPSGSPNPDTALQGQAYALVAITPTQCRVLRADWDAADFAQDSDGDNTLPIPLMPTAAAEYVMLPWIVGATAVPLSDTAYPRQDEAYCLVWEAHYYRRTWVQDMIGYDSIVRGFGGELVLYKSNASTVTRTVLTDDVAPLFASRMKRSPDPFARNTLFAIQDQVVSFVQYAGRRRLVTAVVDAPVDTPIGTPDFLVLPEHDVYCALINVDTGEVERRGVIGRRSRADATCFVTVIQQTLDTPDETLPAVLLATLSDPSQAGFAPGKTYISYDTGDTWHELISDYASRDGMFYLGNTFWRFDNTKPLSKGAKR